MKTYIDERPWEVMIAESVKPTGQYEEFVQMILRDDRIFNGNSTIYDTDIFKRKDQIKALEFQKATLEKTLQTANEKREEAHQLHRKYMEYQKEIDSIPHHKKQDIKELENVKVQIEKRMKELSDAAALLEEQSTGKLDETCTEIAKLEMSLEIWLAYQEIAIKEFTSLRRGIQEYKRIKDIEFLRKAVHWTCAYADKLREPLPKFT